MTEQLLQYFRPVSLAEAEALKQKYGPRAKILIGGDFKPNLEDDLEALIDLQDAGLDSIDWNEDGIKIGGLVSLNTLAENLELPDFSQALIVEFGLNVRNSLSISNFLAQTNGRSPILCCLLALGTKVIELQKQNAVCLLDFLALNSHENPVIELIIPASQSLAFESVGRTPKDLPIVCVAAAKTKDGEINVSAGGCAEVETRFKLESLDDDGQADIKAALAEAEDAWATAEYRQEVGAVLLSRTLQKLRLQAGYQEAK